MAMARSLLGNYDDCYEKRGQAVIIVNKQFPVHSRYKCRNGAERDLSNMVAMFSHLDFFVEVKANCYALDMYNLISRGS